MIRRSLKSQWLALARPGIAGRVRELHVSYRPSSSGIVAPARAIVTPADAATVLVPLIEHEAVEVFVAMHLDAKARILGVQEVARGGLTQTAVSVRPILAACLGEKNSRSLVLCHNHPSGDPEPSPADLELTRRIIVACRLCEIDVIDHLIVGAGTYCSLLETGRLRYLTAEKERTP